MADYKARWQPAARTTAVASVDFSARSDHAAKQKADKIARQLGVTNTPRTIYEGARCVESINKGVSS